jgi:hypothetical protein
MADDNIQDVSGIPANDALAQLELQRKLKMADMLRQSEMPEGQMVSGRFVAPSWTQYAANAMNKYYGGKKEAEAMKGYGEYQKTKASQLGDVLESLKPHEEETQLDVNQAGGMPGVMQTQTVKPDINKTIAFMNKYDPNFGAKIAETSIVKQLTPKEPIKGSAGDVFLNPETFQPLYSVPNKPAVEHIPQIKQLLDIQKTLDPKSQDYKIISDAIKHETTFAPNAATMPVDMAAAKNLADLIGQNKVPPLSGFAMRSPFGQTVMSMVQEQYPSYTSADIGGIKKAVADFSTGKTGNTVRSLNVAVNHLDTLSQLSDALNNNDINLFNKLGNAYAQQTGNPIPTNFNAAKKIVADEIVKGIVGSGGGVQDREEAAASINAANSPAQLKGVIDTYKQLLGGQLSGLKQQYEVSTGKKDFNKFISPNTQKNIGDHSQSTKVNVPAIGEVRSGYKFKGGNPADQNSWEKM